MRTQKMYPFGKPTVLFEWIREIPLEDRRWARNYLASKNLMVSNEAFERHSANFDAPNDLLHREIDSQLRNAWRQRRLRQKLTNKKAYNFILETSSKQKLDKIAENMHSTTTKALHIIIEHETDRIIEHKKKLKEYTTSISNLKEMHKLELLQMADTHRAKDKSHHAIERELNSQIMRSIISDLRSKTKPESPPELSTLKQEALANFKVALAESRARMGSSIIGFVDKFPNSEKLWSTLVNEGPTNTWLNDRVVLNAQKLKFDET